MKKPTQDTFIAFVAAVVVVAAVWYLYPFLTRTTDQAQPVVLTEGQYQQAVISIQDQINLISPTPPTGERWIATEVEFVPESDLVYVTYHDTRNIFRLLLETKQRNSRYRFRAVGAFEKTADGWRLTHGEDPGQGKEIISFIYNPEEETWEEKNNQKG